MCASEAAPAARLYQYTIQSDNIPDLAHWGPILLTNLKKLPGLQDVNSDQQNGGLQEFLTYDRVAAARLGQTAQSLDSLLYSAFGQSEVSVIYTPLNQYYVVLEVAPQYWQSPEGLKSIYISPRFGIVKRDCRTPQHCLTGHGYQEPNRYHAAASEPHRTLPFRHRLVQPGAERFPEPGDPRNSADGTAAGTAVDDSRILCRARCRPISNRCPASQFWF